MERDRRLMFFPRCRTTRVDRVCRVVRGRGASLARVWTVFDRRHEGVGGRWTAAQTRQMYAESSHTVLLLDCFDAKPAG